MALLVSRELAIMSTLSDVGLGLATLNGTVGVFVRRLENIAPVGAPTANIDWIPAKIGFLLLVYVK